MGHPGAEKLWQILRTKAEWADEKEARKITEKVMSQCDTCQACQRPLNTKRQLVHTPIPQGDVERSTLGGMGVWTNGRFVLRGR